MIAAGHRYSVSCVRPYAASMPLPLAGMINLPHEDNAGSALYHHVRCTVQKHIKYLYLVAATHTHTHDAKMFVTQLAQQYFK